MRGDKNLVLWKGLEPSRENSHKYLKLARLPIPPPEQNLSWYSIFFAISQATCLDIRKNQAKANFLK